MKKIIKRKINLLKKEKNFLQKMIFFKSKA
jgi:hypothetical protein